MVKLGLPIVDKHKVVVLTITYNHAGYIEDTLSGFRMQQTSFPFLCCVFDDASTDGEHEVLSRWVENNCRAEDVERYDHPLAIILKAPDKDNPCCIYVIHLQKVNTWGKPEKNDLINYWIQQGEYIALCEGDDFWISPYKLARQVEAFNSNDDVTLVYTAFNTVDKYGNKIERDYYNKLMQRSHSGYILLDLLDGNFILTLTSCFRADIIQNIIKKFSGSVYDYLYFLEAAVNGVVVYLSDVSGSYRLNPNSLMNTKKSQVDSYLWRIYQIYAIKFIKKEIGLNYSFFDRLKAVFKIYLRAIRKMVHLEDSVFIHELLKATFRFK